MKNKDEVIDTLLENAGHGTRREDIVAAFEDGAAWSSPAALETREERLAALLRDALWADPDKYVLGPSFHEQAIAALDEKADT